MVSEKILLFGTIASTLSPVVIAVPKRPTLSTLPVTPPVAITSPTLNGRRNTRNAPAAKLASKPLQARPMATPAAAMRAANVAVSTPRTPRIATKSTTLRSTDKLACTYLSSVGSSCWYLSALWTIRSTTPINHFPTNQSATAPTSFRPTVVSSVRAVALIAFQSIHVSFLQSDRVGSQQNGEREPLRSLRRDSRCDCSTCTFVDLPFPMASAITILDRNPLEHDRAIRWRSTAIGARTSAVSSVRYDSKNIREIASRGVDRS